MLYASSPTGISRTLRVEGVDVVMLGGDEDNVVRAFPGDGDRPYGERLSADRAVPP